LPYRDRPAALRIQEVGRRVQEHALRRERTGGQEGPGQRVQPAEHQIVDSRGSPIRETRPPDERRHASPSRMIPVWAIGVIAAILLVGTVVPGVHLWWPTHQDPIRRSDLGLALMTGALIAFAVLIVQVLVDVRTRQDDRHRQAAAAKQSAEAEKQSLQISLETNDLSGITLKQAKPADFYLRKNNLDAANLD